MEKHGLMDHSRTGGRFPTSRDWNMPTIECKRHDCVANYMGACTMPCRISIKANGKCNGYKQRRVEKGKG